MRLMRYEELLDKLVWIDENTLKDELTDDELERRLMVACQVKKEYEMPNTLWGQLVIFNIPLSYRGVGFQLFIYRTYEENEDQSPELDLTKHAAISIKQFDSSLWTVVYHNQEILGKSDFVERDDYSIEGSLKERVNSLLMKATEDIDWFLDEAENIVRKKCDIMINELQELKEDLDG